MVTEKKQVVRRKNSGDDWVSGEQIRWRVLLATDEHESQSMGGLPGICGKHSLALTQFPMDTSYSFGNISVTTAIISYSSGSKYRRYRTRFTNFLLDEQYMITHLTSWPTSPTVSWQFYSHAARAVLQTPPIRINWTWKPCIEVKGLDTMLEEEIGNVISMVWWTGEDDVCSEMRAVLPAGEARCSMPLPAPTTRVR